MQKTPVQHIYYFTDESSYLTDKFMAVAGLAIPDRELASITAELRLIQANRGGPSETKWSTTKSKRDSSHRAFIDYFKAGIDSNRFHFHIRFAPFEQYDHKASGPRRRIDTTSKMHYQLLLHRAVRFYGPHYKLRIRLDGGDCTAGLADQIHNLQTWGHYKYDADPGCIEGIEQRDSATEVALQLLDVPLGAFTALRNQRELIGAKKELADYVQSQFPNAPITGNSPKNEQRFSIWNVVPSGAPKRGPWG